MTHSKIATLCPDNNDGLPAELVSRLWEKGLAHGLEEIIPIKSKDIQVANWVQLKCQYGCQRYNQSWCCPPATPSPEEVQSILDEYSLALLLISKEEVWPEFNRQNLKNRINQVQYWKGTIGLERTLFLAGYYKSFSLVGVCCALCKECAYPKDCNFPQEKRPSIESFSIDVFGTLKKLNRRPKILQSKDDMVKSYSIIMVE